LRLSGEQRCFFEGVGRSEATEEILKKGASWTQRISQGGEAEQMAITVKPF